MTLAHKRNGFTLVEMLVVVAIIGTLVALMIPAINMARGAAQRAQCTNQQRELGMAILSYEQAKQRLPGVVNLANPTNLTDPLRTNWVMAIFSNLGREDLAEHWRDGIVATNNLGNHRPVKVDQLICPSNKLADGAGGLSYVLNTGVYYTDANNFTGRLFRNKAAVTGAATNVTPEPDVTLTNLKSTARTVMLSESLNAGPWYSIPAVQQKGQWQLDSTTNVPFFSSLAFAWPNNPNPPSPPPGTPINNPLTNMTLVTQPSSSQPLAPNLSSNHGGRIIVFFFDGHVETLPDTTNCWEDATNQIYGAP